MDLISGIAIVTAFYLLALGVIAHALNRVSPLTGNAAAGQLEQMIHHPSRTTLVALLIGFFVGLADVLVAAQLAVIAFLNVAVGVATIAIIYSVSRHQPSDDEDWRR